ncbi:MAG: 30S ribosomal protein S9 [Verrucomicrobiota bacterium]
MATETPILATGRRKTAVATVKMTSGNGAISVNGKDFNDYFTTGNMKQQALTPLVVTENAKKFNLEVRARGGGLNGQAGALRLAIARALLKLNSENRGVLRANGLLTRDPRAKERKKPGQPGARKRFQFSKR